MTRDHGLVRFSGSGDPWDLPDEERPAAVHGLAYAPDGRQHLEVGNVAHHRRVIDLALAHPSSAETSDPIHDDRGRKARAIGPVRPGWLRIIALEHDASLRHTDYPTRAEAPRGADDAASETDSA
ncbi:MAG: hypothetical protein A2138_15320 [Deltaproteobacteria bacterium RBG_16_71_12]|nr:MAG: hypothetical protein A2138_15320 [Deltaproteobacteria bacterium RBG_16_71_12]